MSEYRTPTRQGNALDAAAEYLDWPKALAAALAALAIAVEHDRQARAIAAVGRKELDEAWLADKADHDLAEASTKAPEDFEPYPVPRPDVGALQDLASIYNRRKLLAQSAVDSEASDYGRLFKRSSGGSRR